MISRLPLVLTLLATLACRSAESPGAPLENAPRPNILFIFSDDHAAQAISAYGSRLCETPNIDRLAREGMLFANCFCGNSICAPSRATVLTGLHTHANGVIDNGVEFDGSQQTFPKLLQGAGYQTAIVGKWHLKSAPTGFDHWQVLVGQGPYYNPPIRSAAGTHEIEGYTTEVITDLALDWLRDGRDPERPFLLMYQHKAPHRNWQPGPDELGMFDDVTFPEPPTLFDDWANRTSACTTQAMTLRDHMTLPSDLKLRPPRNLTEAQLAAWNASYEPKRTAFEAAGLAGDELVRWKYQRYMQDYLACVSAVDRELGRVLDWLDESGLAENTIVVYSSDQGFFLGEHGWYDKRWMYEESLRMPLIVRWPDAVAAGSRCRELVQNIDFAPTFLELAGVRPPQALHGQSIVPLLRGETPEDWRESIYYHYYEFPGAHSVQRHYGVRTERHKLIHYYDIDEHELFDLHRDPDELRRVWADPEYAVVRLRLEYELERLQGLYGEREPEATGARVHQANARLRAREFEPTVVFEVADLDAPTPTADPRARPLTVAARLIGRGDGVVVALGGESYGFCLQVTAGQPELLVRNHGRLFRVTGDTLWPGRVTHVAGILDADGGMSLLLDGRLVAKAQGEVIERRPSEGLALGRDPGSHVGENEDDNPYTGSASDIRLHWGARADLVKVWAAAAWR